MDVCYSHNTALYLWRIWSESHPLSVDEFHGLRPSDVRHLPSHVLRSSQAFTHCANSWGKLAQVVENVSRPSLAKLLKHALWVPPLGSCVHVLTFTSAGQRKTKGVKFHQLSNTPPKGLLLELAPHVFCVSPEGLFIQMAETLSLGTLVALGFELCGCYPLENSVEPLKVRGQLTTPARIAALAERCNGMRGVRKARVAIQYVQAKSASVMETEMCMLASMPVHRGGFGLPVPELNARVNLSPAASKVARSDYLVLDAFWPSGRVALEYDGRLSHSGEAQQVRDSRRRAAFATEGISMATLTWSQLSSVQEFEEIVAYVRRQLGQKKRARKLDFLDKHSELRRQIRRFHFGEWWHKPYGC